MKKRHIKKILLDIIKYQNELCSVCELYGQKLPECKCMRDEDCVNHIIELAKKAIKSKENAS